MATAKEEEDCLQHVSKNLLHPTIYCCVGTRVKINGNIATQLGLFNGAMGTIHSFGLVTHDDVVRVEVIFVQMDNVNDNLTCDLSTISPTPNLIPIVRTVSQTKISHRFFRRQFPISVAFARTVHSAQGITTSAGVVVYPQINIFARGLEYVGVSRATAIENVILMSPLLEIHFNNPRFAIDCEIIRNEYTRLVNL